MKRRATLRKADILRGYRSFTGVIAGGTSYVARPVRLFFVIDSTARPGITMGFTAARTIRGAVRRNRVKRLLREAYRIQGLNVREQMDHAGTSVRAVLMYVGSSPEHPGQIRFHDVERPVGQLLGRLAAAVKGTA